MVICHVSYGYNLAMVICYVIILPKHTLSPRFSYDFYKLKLNAVAIEKFNS